MEGVRLGTLKLGEVSLHVAKAGPEDGALVILLHGFPEFWYGWRKQMPFLAAAGYRVWAPDQRGYNLSSKPKRVRAYRTSELAKDVMGLIEASGRARVHLVGHDWGGVVAWEVARRYPDKLERLVILNAPHPGAYGKFLRERSSQRRKSLYLLLFQLPLLPELGLKRHNWRSLEATLRKSSAPGTFSEEELARYRQAWSQEGAMASMINWYRAAWQGPSSPAAQEVTVPTLVLWGKQDAFLEPELAQRSLNYCRNGHVSELNASHWLHLEQAERVNERILAHLRG